MQVDKIIFFTKKQAKLKSLKVAKWRKDDEDICECRVAFATENFYSDLR